MTAEEIEGCLPGVVIILSSLSRFLQTDRHARDNPPEGRKHEAKSLGNPFTLILGWIIPLRWHKDFLIYIFIFTILDFRIKQTFSFKILVYCRQRVVGCCPVKSFRTNLLRMKHF